MHDMSGLLMLGGDIHPNPGPQNDDARNFWMGAPLCDAQGYYPAGNVGDTRHFGGNVPIYNLQEGLYQPISFEDNHSQMLSMYTRLEQALWHLETNTGERLDMIHQEMKCTVNCMKGLYEEQRQMWMYCQYTLGLCQQNFQYLANWNASIQEEQNAIKEQLMPLKKGHPDVRPQRVSDTHLNSVHLFGVREDSHELPEELTHTVSWLVDEALPDVPWASSKIVDAVRVGQKKRHTNSPRPVLVNFAERSDKVLLLEQGRNNLRNMGVRVSGKTFKQDRSTNGSRAFAHFQAPVQDSHASPVRQAELYQDSSWGRQGKRRRRTRRQKTFISRNLVQIPLQGAPIAEAKLRRDPVQPDVREADVVSLLRVCRLGEPSAAVGGEDAGGAVHAPGHLPHKLSRGGGSLFPDSDFDDREEGDASDAEGVGLTTPFDDSPSTPPKAGREFGGGASVTDEAKAASGSCGRTVQCSMLDWLEPAGSSTGSDNGTKDDDRQLGADVVAGANAPNFDAGPGLDLSVSADDAEVHEVALEQEGAGIATVESTQERVWQGRLRQSEQVRPRRTRDSYSAQT